MAGGGDEDEEIGDRNDSPWMVDMDEGDENSPDADDGVKPRRLASGPS